MRRKREWRMAVFMWGKLAVSCTEAHGGILSPVADSRAKSPSY